MKQSKDWIGCKNLEKMLGGGGKMKREENDFYATDPAAVEMLLDGLWWLSPRTHNIWECACGSGNISEVLKNKGYTVYSSDLVYRDYGIPGVDFLKQTKLIHERVNVIMTNPPYKYQTEFILHALELLPKYGLCIMLLNLNSLSGIDRYNRIFKCYPPEKILVFSRRVKCYRMNDKNSITLYGGSAINYAWFMWRKGYDCSTTIDWLI